MANSVFHKADTRGDADHGWLHSRHTFSFADYYDPERVHFGMLRVLNDDIVAAGMGFGTHPHDNMEIVSIPLEGDLEHKDSMGNVYDQITLHVADRHNSFQQILSPDPDDAGVWIYQNAWFHLGRLDKGFKADYNIKAKGNGVYAFILSGEVTIENQKLKQRDGFGIWDVEKIKVTADTNAEILLMEVPMR